MTNGSVAFDRAADYYDRTRGFPPGVEQAAGKLMVEAGQLSAASRVLEVGVGTGRIALPVAPHVGAYYGVDLARPMLDRLVAKRGNEPVYPLLGDATLLPFADGAFDAVIAVHIFHLIPAWSNALSEVRRVLRPTAPLLHGWNARLAHDALQAAWDKATDESVTVNGKVSTDWRRNFLAESGWREVGATQTYAYTVQRAPQEFYDSMAQRYFSSTWRMSEEQLERGLAAVREYIRHHYDDPTQPETLDASFHVQAYLPPVSL